MLRELIALNSQSKVWIYQANKELSYDEIDFLRPSIFEFVQKWSSHGSGVDAYGNVFHRRFIGLFADETSSVSGCSIDSSVGFIRSMGESLGVDFFRRTDFAFLKEDEVVIFDQSEIGEAFEKGNIDESTFVFDNLVKTKEQFLEAWLKPFSESWHYRLK